MLKNTKILLLLIALQFASQLYAQIIAKAIVIDATTKEPLVAATVRCQEPARREGGLTNASGYFELRCPTCSHLVVSCLGYTTQQVKISDKLRFIALIPAVTQLQAVVLTANRGDAARRTEVPVAITSIFSKTIQDTKATMADQLLNKVSGVNMVNLGNEQHQMSIRQPMTTKGLFLYLEDGIPIRSTGLFNHNALLEMNMAATKSIEVIKGPSSSLYGSEAIGGVVNFISGTPTVVPVLRLSLQGNNVGYKRADLVSSISTGKWGFLLSGYHSSKHDGFLEYSDFHKTIFTVKVNYRFSGKTSLSNSFTFLDYYSDMAGGIDSAMFANRVFTDPQTFTYRKVAALRYHSTLVQNWNGYSKTTLTALYRNNSIGQNPAYRVKDDYRRILNGFTGRKDLAHGEINVSEFNSFSIIAQHRQDLRWKKALLTGGFNLDLSPSKYEANYIRIQKDTNRNKYVRYENTDSAPTNYRTGLNNYAGFVNFECSPLAALRLVASLRYDYFKYKYDNHLQPSAFSGAPDTLSVFGRLSPKLGLTYNFSPRVGVYANYAQGFIPPQVTELYTGVKAANLGPAVFDNYELGGWINLISGKLAGDISLYRLKGTNEIISVKLDDGSFANANAGKTLHRGLELGLTATAGKDFSFRLSGACSNHSFIEYVEKGVSYNGNEMSNAPHWIYNTEIWYKPATVPGLRAGIELQHVGRYFTDPQNSAMYDGYFAWNLRLGYTVKSLDIWLNLLNATNNYYSYITTKSSFGWTYQLGEPRNFNLGIAYDFGHLFYKE